MKNKNTKKCITRRRLEAVFSLYKKNPICARANKQQA